MAMKYYIGMKISDRRVVDVDPVYITLSCNKGHKTKIAKLTIANSSGLSYNRKCLACSKELASINHDKQSKLNNEQAERMLKEIEEREKRQT